MRCWAAVREETKPASRSTFRCLDMVGWLTASAPTSSPTLLSERRSSSRIRRRVGSASTAKASTGMDLICVPRHMPVNAYASTGDRQRAEAADHELGAADGLAGELEAAEAVDQRAERDLQ